MRNKLHLFWLTIASVFALAGCNPSSSGNVTSSNKDTSSSLSANRAAVVDVLKLFSSKNGLNTVSYRFLSEGAPTDSAVKPVAPVSSVTYISSGFEVKFASGWDSGKATYGFLNMPVGNSLTKETGVYGYHYESGLDTNGKTVSVLTLDDAVSTSVKDTYDFYATPKYLFDHAENLAPLFLATSRSEVNNCSDVIATVNMAKALSVYGVLTAAVPSISFTNVELSYSASSTSFTFAFYINYSGVNYLGARAVLSGFGSTANPNLTNYLKSITPEVG